MLKEKHIVLSHACKHKPVSHIMPYWSDRVRRKLAENMNTAWGGSLKLETSLLSMVFSSSGNHLVAHAYQVLTQSLSLLSAFFRHCCLLQWCCELKKKLKLPANLSNLRSLIIFSTDEECLSPPKKKSHEQPFLVPLQCSMAGVRWQCIYRYSSDFTLQL